MELNVEIPLVGREEEVAVLLELKRQIQQEDCKGTKTLVVHGQSGSGKTALCQQVLIDHQADVYSITGKFEQYMDYASPYSALVGAFNNLGKQVLANKDKDPDVLAAVQQGLSLEGGLILAQLIPSFQEIMGMKRLKITPDDLKRNHPARKSLLISKQQGPRFPDPAPLAPPTLETIESGFANLPGMTNGSQVDKDDHAAESCQGGASVPLRPEESVPLDDDKASDAQRQEGRKSRRISPQSHLASQLASFTLSSLTKRQRKKEGRSLSPKAYFPKNPPRRSTTTRSLSPKVSSSFERSLSLPLLPAPSSTTKSAEEQGSIELPSLPTQLHENSLLDDSSCSNQGTNWNSNVRGEDLQPQSFPLLPAPSSKSKSAEGQGSMELPPPPNQLHKSSLLDDSSSSNQGTNWSSNFRGEDHRPQSFLLPPAPSSKSKSAEGQGSMELPPPPTQLHKISLLDDSSSSNQGTNWSSNFRGEDHRPQSFPLPPAPSSKSKSAEGQGSMELPPPPTQLHKISLLDDSSDFDQETNTKSDFWRDGNIPVAPKTLTVTPEIPSQPPPQQLREPTALVDKEMLSPLPVQFKKNSLLLDDSDQEENIRIYFLASIPAGLAPLSTRQEAGLPGARATQKTKEKIQYDVRSEEKTSMPLPPLKKNTLVMDDADSFGVTDQGISFRGSIALELAEQTSAQFTAFPLVTPPGQLKNNSLLITDLEKETDNGKWAPPQPPAHLKNSSLLLDDSESEVHDKGASVPLAPSAAMPRKNPLRVDDSVEGKNSQRHDPKRQSLIQSNRSSVLVADTGPDRDAAAALRSRSQPLPGPPQSDRTSLCRSRSLGGSSSDSADDESSTDAMMMNQFTPPEISKLKQIDQTRGSFPSFSQLTTPHTKISSPCKLAKEQASPKFAFLGIPSAKKSLIIESDSECEDRDRLDLDAAIRVSMLHHQKTQQKKNQQRSNTSNFSWSQTNLTATADDEPVPPPPPLLGQQTFFQKTAERLAVAFGVFLTKFCSPQRPLVLFVDDLQWADQNSTDLLALLANDATISNLLIVACFRDEKDESPDDLTPRQQFKSQLFTFGDVPELHITNLSLKGVQAMITQILRHGEDDDQRQVLELAEIVGRKTHGSPYFVVQFLQLLVREGLVNYNFATFQWQWDAALVQGVDVSDNVLSVVLKRLESLPTSVQRLLVLAAFVGYYTNIVLLEALYMRADLLPDLSFSHGKEPHQCTFSATTKATDPQVFSSMSLANGSTSIPHSPSSFSIKEMLQTAIKEGFAEIVGGLFEFSHDRVQETAYGLVSDPTMREELHWKIGEVVHDVFVKQKAFEYGDRFVFVAADQLNRGSSGIKTNRQRLDLIRLNWEASKVAGQKSSMNLMAVFLQKAIALTDEADWRTDDATYYLLLEIFTRAVEVEASRGNLKRSQEIASSVLRNTRQPEDGRGAKIANAHAYGWSMQWELAIKEARDVLALCGETLAPSKEKSVQKQLELIKGLVKGKRDDELTNLPPMTDDLKISAMKMLKFGRVFGFAVDPHFSILCVLKMMELTLEYGHLIETGGFALSGFGCVLANFARNEKREAYRFAQLSLKVSGDKASIPGTALNIYGYLSHIQQPTSRSLEPTLAAYRTGLEVGDMAFGGVCITLYAMLYVMNGLKLQPYVMDMKKISRQLKLFQQDFCSLYVVVGLQLALSLSSETDELFPMTWDGITKGGHFPTGINISKMTEGQPPQLLLLYFSAFEMYILNDWHGLRMEMKKLYGMKSRHFPGYHFINFLFLLIEGLSAVALFLVFQKRKYKLQAKKAQERLQSAAKDGSSDACLFLQLLTALKYTMAWPKPSPSLVKKKLDAAIAQLSKSGFLHLAALANERLGDFMAQQKDDDWAMHYRLKASSLYEEWGAHRKVSEMKRSFQFIEASRAAPPRNFALRGRQRHSSLLPQRSSRDVDKEIASTSLNGSSSFLNSPPFTHGPLLSGLDSFGSHRSTGP